MLPSNINIKDIKLHSSQLLNSSETKQGIIAIAWFEQSIPLQYTLDDIIDRLSKDSDSTKTDKIAKKIFNLLQLLPEKNHIHRVLANKWLKITCISLETAIEMLGKENILGANHFDAKSKTIYLLNEREAFGVKFELTLDIINHEFIHADCFIKNVIYGINYTNNISFPIKVTPENVANYETGLKAGHERIKEFKKLWDKQKDSGLPAKEKTIFDRYQQASQDCLKYTFQFPIGDLKQLKKQNLKIGDKFEHQNEKLIVTKIELLRNRFLPNGTPLIFAEYLDSAPNHYYALLESSKSLNEPCYANASPETKILEEDAYARQLILSLTALNTFYPEITKLLIYNDYVLSNKDYQSLQHFAQTHVRLNKELQPYLNFINDKQPASALRFACINGDFYLANAILEYIKQYDHSCDITSKSSKGEHALTLLKRSSVFPKDQKDSLNTMLVEYAKTLGQKFED